MSHLSLDAIPGVTGGLELREAKLIQHGPELRRPGQDLARNAMHTALFRLVGRRKLGSMPQELRDKNIRADEPQLVSARVGQVITDYPDLDYLLCFQSESIFADKARYKIWHNVFDGFYKAIVSIAGEPSVLEKVWIDSKERLTGLPKVFYVELFGRTTQANLPVRERIIPD